MTVAISRRRRRRAPRPWSAPRPATPRPRRRRTPPGPGCCRRAGARRARSRPASWPRRSCTAPRCCRSTATSTTACELARKLADDYPVALVNSVNPVRIEGQKTAAFEIVDVLGDAPDVHVLPVGNAGNISAYWHGYTQYASAGKATRTPADVGLPGRGRRAAGARPAGARPRDRGHRDPDRQPRLVEAGRGRARRVRRADRGRHRRADPRRAGVLAARGRRLRRAGVGGRRRRACWPSSDRGEIESGLQIVVTVTGHGLKDIDTALSGRSGSGRGRDGRLLVAASVCGLMATRVRSGHA